MAEAVQVDPPRRMVRLALTETPLSAVKAGAGAEQIERQVPPGSEARAEHTGAVVEAAEQARTHSQEAMVERAEMAALTSSVSSATQPLR